MLRPSCRAPHRRALTRLALIFAVSGLGVHIASAEEFVVPSDLEHMEGDIQNCFPLTGCGEHRRYQQVFANSELDVLGAPVFITAMRSGPMGSRWRPTQWRPLPAAETNIRGSCRQAAMFRSTVSL